MTDAIPHGQTPDAVTGTLATGFTDGFDWTQLSRWPLQTDAGLQAHDAADLLLLDTLATWTQVGHPLEPVVVIDDRHGALTLPLLAAGHRVRLTQDSIVHERSITAALDRVADQSTLDPSRLQRGVLGPELLSAARTVLLPLPRSLDELDQIAHAVAAHADSDVVFLAGGRDKHMSSSMNEVLARSFSSVVAGRGRSKSRVLTARGPLQGREEPFPRTRDHHLPDVGPVTLASFGATFGGARLDPGTHALLQVLSTHLDPTAVQADQAVDVGSGNGTIATWLALRFPQLQVVGTDASSDAVRSTTLSAELNGVSERVRVVRDDALSSLPGASERLLVLNPPFHAGHLVDPSVAHRLIQDSARVLQDGGELWCVWNSHLRYRPLLESAVGPTRQLDRDRQFTVTVSSRRR